MGNILKLYVTKDDLFDMIYMSWDAEKFITELLNHSMFKYKLPPDMSKTWDMIIDLRNSDLITMYDLKMINISLQYLKSKNIITL